MRQLGSFQTKILAERFCDYLTVKKISWQSDVNDQNVILWIHDEDQLAEAHEAFVKFQENPEATKFIEAGKQAKEIQATQIELAAKNLRQQIKLRKQSEPPVPSDLLITYLLIAISLMVTLKYQIEGTNFGIFPKISITEFYESPGNKIAWYPGLEEIQEGEIWRLITPIFLHMDPLHFLFNMYWLYLFGRLLEPRLSSWRLLLFVIAASVCSNLIQYYWNSPMFGGMSGVVYALFGFIWAKRDWEPKCGIFIEQRTVQFMIGWMFLCMILTEMKLLPVANAAHVSGLVFGYLIAIVRPVFQKLLR